MAAGRRGRGRSGTKIAGEVVRCATLMTCSASVARQASDELKKTYRKLAKKLHPDANDTDPNAATKFAELNGAYEILGDETKRKQFDRGEIDAEGKPRFHGFEGVRPGAGGRGGPGGFPASRRSRSARRTFAGPAAAAARPAAWTIS